MATMIERLHALDVGADEASLVRSASTGDRDAFGELYEKYSRMVHGILLARVPFSDAEDLLQEVFLCAMRNLRGLRNPAAFPGWLASIARRMAVNYHRAARNHEDAAGVPLGVESNAESRREALSILETISALPEAYRETLILRLVEGLTGPEIAQQTGMTADSVRVNLCRGMRMLREKLGRSDAP
jgi:RNA polymerase sigma-70 factor, ECF subfamily